MRGEEPARRRLPTSQVILLLLAAVVGVPSVGYAGAYVHARVTHRLVSYGSFIARPDAMHGIGYSTEELVFAPLILLEETVRGM
ncbi:MAG: hypothetical protein AB7S26_03715 [Sandaracinaceae bacterium]